VACWPRSQRSLTSWQQVRACLVRPADRSWAPIRSMITLQPMCWLAAVVPAIWHVASSLTKAKAQTRASSYFPVASSLHKPKRKHVQAPANPAALLERGTTPGLEPSCSPFTSPTTELDETPRKHAAVLLLGEVAAYLSDWHPPCLGAARRFAAMTSRAADDLVCVTRLIRAAWLACVGRLLCLLLSGWHPHALVCSLGPCCQQRTLEWAGDMLCCCIYYRSPAAHLRGLMACCYMHHLLTCTLEIARGMLLHAPPAHLHT